LDFGVGEGMGWDGRKAGMALLFHFWRVEVSRYRHRPAGDDLDQAAGPPRLGGREMLSSMEEVSDLSIDHRYQKDGIYRRFWASFSLIWNYYAPTLCPEFGVLEDE
jgi:hypothetical protein